MLTIRSLLVFGLLCAVDAAPQSRTKATKATKASATKQKASTAQQQAAQIAQGISTATDGSMILDTTAQIK